MDDFTDPTAQELDRQSNGLKVQAERLRADAKDKITRAESLEEAARILWHRGYIIDRDHAAKNAAEADYEARQKAAEIGRTETPAALLREKNDGR